MEEVMEAMEEVMEVMEAEKEVELLVLWKDLIAIATIASVKKDMSAVKDMVVVDMVSQNGKRNHTKRKKEKKQVFFHMQTSSLFELITLKALFDIQLSHNVTFQIGKNEKV